MPSRGPGPISPAEHAARQERVAMIAHRLGFVGTVEYRHASSSRGGAQYGMGPSMKQDLLVVDADAFRRDAAGDDFSLEAMIAHERGHQLLCRHERLRRVLPKAMSTVTEEVLASLVGALVAIDARDGRMLVLKALGELVENGMRATEAARRVEELLQYLEEAL